MLSNIKIKRMKLLSLLMILLCFPFSILAQNFSIKLFIEDNINSKIDFRPVGFNFTSLANNFEIFIYAVKYPVFVTADFIGISTNPYEGYSKIH